MSQHSAEYRVISIRPILCIDRAKRFLGEDYWLFLGIALVASFIGSAGPMGMLLGPMMCGVHICHRHRDIGIPVRFETLFKGFDYFIEGMIASVILMCGMMVVIVPMYFVMFLGVFAPGFAGGRGPGIFINQNIQFGNILGFFAVFYFVLLLLLLLFEALMIFTFPLIVDRKMPGIDAVKLGARAAWANFGGVFALVLLANSIQVVGTIFCILPGILFIPLKFAAYHMAYNRVFAETVPEPQKFEETGLGEEPTSLRERDFAD